MLLADRHQTPTMGAIRLSLAGYLLLPARAFHLSALPCSQPEVAQWYRSGDKEAVQYYTILRIVRSVRVKVTHDADNTISQARIDFNIN